MEFSEVVKKRRSIRRFKPDQVPDHVIVNALEAATLAPNSSNTQTWDFYWVKTPELKAKLVDACLGQSAARTASHLVVICADPKKWKRSQSGLIKWVEDCKAPKPVHLYYKNLIPVTYRWGLFNSFGLLKWFGTFFAGFFRAVPRGPSFKGEHQLVAVKSAALAAENFVLSITDQGYATCMMEGFESYLV